ncbi:hypothetical protein [Actinoplanes sp. NPDC020271]|uniref:hypothetical protein n=1 Tax=Actinoplanes sp. NPDC020271 TaxID=3363896 RepID=UPI0037B148B5
MGRRAPRAVRAQSYTPLAQPVEGLSSRANAEIARIQHLRPDLEVRRALLGYRRTTRQPRRWLPGDGCYSLDEDLCEQRDVLEATLRMLPAPARRELWRLVAPLDDLLLRTTVPDHHPGRVSPWYAAAWWRRRMAL